MSSGAKTIYFTQGISSGGSLSGFRKFLVFQSRSLNIGLIDYECSTQRKVLRFLHSES